MIIGGSRNGVAILISEGKGQAPNLPDGCDVLLDHGVIVSEIKVTRAIAQKGTEGAVEHREFGLSLKICGGPLGEVGIQLIDGDVTHVRRTGMHLGRREASLYHILQGLLKMHGKGVFTRLSRGVYDYSVIFVFIIRDRRLRGGHESHLY